MDFIRWYGAIYFGATPEERQRFVAYIDSIGMVEEARNAHMAFLARGIGSGIASFMDEHGASWKYKEIECDFDLNRGAVIGRTRTVFSRPHTQNCCTTLWIHDGKGDGGSITWIKASDDFNRIATNAMHEYVPNPKYDHKHKEQS